jgi:hypothetical protein
MLPKIDQAGPALWECKSLHGMNGPIFVLMCVGTVIAAADKCLDTNENLKIT